MQLKNEVNLYIAKAPKPIRPRLKELRKVIQKVAPKAEESISYKMPYYSYKGRLAWFASMKGYIGLYLPPPIIKNHEKELKKYTTTKSAIHFPNDNTLPISLIKKLVKARMKINDVKDKTKL